MSADNTKRNYRGIIENVEKVALDTFSMDIVSNLENIIPGQFISVLCPNRTLRRPFSPADFNKEKNTLTIIFKLRGEGTNYLKNLKKGDEINFLAPLGNGFELINNKKALLVGAGVGIAPMLFLKKELNKKNIENYLIGGFKISDEVIKGSDETVIGGSVLDNLEEIIKEKNIEIIYSCAPLIVLKNIAQMANDYSITAQLAMEKVMACSIGVCRGCVIKLFKNNSLSYASVCKDGPVFLGSEIVWE